LKLIQLPSSTSRSRNAAGQRLSISLQHAAFGEQTDEVLAKFGFAADEIGALKQDKVV
jgi:crotonobetainyl-CoA:carnitine CoA-transferase CaiB-like acyl-CoA transferase